MKGINDRKIMVPTAFIILFMAFSLSVVSADTYNASTLSFSDVKSAVKAARDGDTVLVPSGNSTWNETLFITKNIILEGAGIGETIITAGSGVGTSGLINFEPDSFSRTSGELFRVTGFEFRGDDKRIIVLNNPTGTYVNTIRIDHNKFEGVQYGARFSGYIDGLIDNNIFIDVTLHEIYVLGRDDMSWENLSTEPGESDLTFIEDNEFINSGSLVGGGHGSGYVLRHNDIKLSMDYVTFLDAHGNLPSGGDPNPIANRGTRVTEVYENDWTGITRTVQLLDLRGGVGILFNNKLTGTGATPYVRLREEDAPNAFNSAPSTVVHGGQYYECENNHYSSIISEPGIGSRWQDYWHICGDCPRYTASPSYNNGAMSTRNWEVNTLYVDSPAYDPVKGTYLWNNKFNGNEEIKGIINMTGDNYYIVEDRDYFNFNQNFTGTSGCGYGLLTSRPNSGLVAGVGYYSTDNKVLYRAVNSSTWEEYYTPYTYPHPLRGEEILYGETSIGSPQGLRIMEE